MTNTKQVTEYFARIFVDAAALNTNLVLLNSTSRRFPNGLGNDSGLLGRYVAFHNYRSSLNATYDGFLDGYYYGRRPTTAFMPNFRNVHGQETSGPACPGFSGVIWSRLAQRGRGVWPVKPRLALSSRKT